jgi:hypothetical protein
LLRIDDNERQIRRLNVQFQCIVSGQTRAGQIEQALAVADAGATQMTFDPTNKVNTTPPAARKI